MLTSVVHAIHNSVRRQRAKGTRFRRPIAPFIPAPRNLPGPPWLVPACGFLIANPRLEISASPTKQTIGAKSNRERIAFPTPDFCSCPEPPMRPFTPLRPNKSRSSPITRHSSRAFLIGTIGLLEIHLNAAETILTHFLTGTKPHIPAFSLVHSRRFSSARIQPPADCPPAIANRLESERKWQSPLKLFARNQSQAKIS